MLEISGIPFRDPLCRAILEKHVGRLLRLETVFAAQLAAGSTEWKPSVACEIRKALCPPGICTDKDRRRLIESLYTHLYAIDTVPAPREERYTLARICGMAVHREESMIARIAESGNCENLRRWLASYQIADSSGRQYLLSACQSLPPAGFPGNRETVGKEAEALVRSCYDGGPALPFEYPTAVLMTFRNEELDTFADMQPKAEAGRLV